QSSHPRGPRKTAKSRRWWRIPQSRLFPRRLRRRLRLPRIIFQLFCCSGCGGAGIGPPFSFAFDFVRLDRIHPTGSRAGHLPQKQKAPDPIEGLSDSILEAPDSGLASLFLSFTSLTSSTSLTSFQACAQCTASNAPHNASSASFVVLRISSSSPLACSS